LGLGDVRAHRILHFLCIRWWTSLKSKRDACHIFIKNRDAVTSRRYPEESIRCGRMCLHS
jgi:hypothetical protein